MAKTTLNISDELMEQVKIKCIKDKKKLTEAVTEALTQWIGEAKVETPPQEYKPVPLIIEEPKKDSRDDIDSWFTPAKWK